MISGILEKILWLFIEMSPYILLGMTFVAILNFFFNKDFILKHIGKDNISSIIKAAIFGIPLPLCSCGVIPTAVYMDKSGASKSATVSFLVSTPQTGVDSIIATYGMMGGVFAIFRPFAALAMGIISGLIIRPFEKNNKKKPSDISFNIINKKTISSNETNIDKKEKAKKSIKYAFVEFIDDISIQFIIGVILSGLIAYFIPDNFFAESGVSSGILAMSLVVLIGPLMYICATASIPIAVVLMLKGFSPGVAFVLLSVGPATSAASLAILFKVFGKKITSIYLASIIITAMFFGYLLDFIFSITGLDPLSAIPHHLHSHEMGHNLFFIILAILLGLLLLTSLYRKYIRKYIKTESDELLEKGVSKLTVYGMTCQNCANNVKSTINNISGLEVVNVNVETNSVYLKGNYNIETLSKEIESIGYKLKS